MIGAKPGGMPRDMADICPHCNGIELTMGAIYTVDCRRCRRQYCEYCSEIVKKKFADKIGRTSGDHTTLTECAFCTRDKRRRDWTERQMFEYLLKKEKKTRKDVKKEIRALNCRRSQRLKYLKHV